jgi:hypothetical protein
MSEAKVDGMSVERAVRFVDGWNTRRRLRFDY